MPLRLRIRQLTERASLLAAAGRAPLWLPAAVLLVGVACTLAVASLVRGAQERDQRDEFSRLVARSQESLQARLMGPMAALRGALRPVLGALEGPQLEALARELVASGDHPGLRTIASLHQASPAPAGGPGQPSAPTRFEPAWSAPEAVGETGATIEPTPFAQALEHAARSGEPVVWPHPATQSLLLMLAGDRTVPATGARAVTQAVTAARSKADPKPAPPVASRGVLVARVDVPQVMASLGAAGDGRIEVELFAGSEPAPAMRLGTGGGSTGAAAAPPPRFVELRPMALAGQPFTLRARTTAAFAPRHALLPQAVLLVGCLLALMAAALVRLLALGGQRVRERARAITADLERVSAEQRLALQTLARQQAQLEAVVAGTGCGVLLWNVPSGEVQVGDGLAGLLGHTPEELRPMNRERWVAMTHPADLPAASAAVAELIRGRRDHAEYDVRMRHRSGRWLWTQVRATATEREANGRTVYLSAIYVDIDERKQAAERWQLRATLSSDWYWQTDALHRVQDVSGYLPPGVLAVPSEYQGKRRDEIPWFEPPAGGWAAFHAMLDRQEAFKGVVYCSHSTGGDRWVEIDGQPRFDADGQFLGYAGVGREITERRRVTEQLRESLAVLDALLASLPVPVIMKDRERRFQRVNPAYERQLGRPASAVLGRRLIELSDADPETAARHDAEDRQIIDGGARVHYEVHQRRPDGREVDLLIYKSPVVGADGGVIGLVSISVDITERRQVERALERERARLADILAGSNAGIVEWDLVLGTLSVDERYAAMLGESRDALQTQTREHWEQRLHAEDQARFAAAVNDHVEGRSDTVALDVRLRHRQGHWVWVHIRGRVTQRDADGRARIFTGANFDVTERHIAAERWRARAELSGDWFWQTDAEHRFLDMVSSDTFEPLTRPSEVHGRRRDEVPWFDPPEGGWDAFHAMLDRHEPFKGVVYLNRTYEGDPRWIEIDGRPRLDETGRFYGYDGVGRDVTERRRVTEQLRQSLAQLDSLIRAVPIPLVMKDREGRNFRVNDAYCSFYGVTEAQTLGRTVFDFWEPEVAARYHAEDQALMADRRVRRTPVQVWTHTRQRLDILVHKSPIVAPDGEVVGIVGAVVDMSEQEAASRALREAKEAAESANRAKSAFLATMSHEIRTPMNGVIGMAELLAHTALSDDQSRQVHTIVDSARSLLAILDDILDFSKIEAGRLELETQAVALAPLVEAACDALAPLAQAAGVALHVHVDAALPERVLADPTRLRQIVTNLLGNAIKFSAAAESADGEPERPAARTGRPPGRVAVRARAAGLAGDEAGTELLLEVSDNGIGMDAWTQSRLFVPFSQGEISTTRRFGGTGLGLAIIHRLVEVMRGRIEVASAPGQGSRFTVHLPLRAAAAADVGADAAPAPAPPLQGVHCRLAGGLERALEPGFERDAGPEPTAPGQSPAAQERQRQADLLAWLRDAGALLEPPAAAEGSPTAVWLRPAPRAAAPGASGSDPGANFSVASMVTSTVAPTGDPTPNALAEPARVGASGQSGAGLPSAPGETDHTLWIGEGPAAGLQLLGPTLARIDQPRRQSLVRAVAVLAGRASPAPRADPPQVQRIAGASAGTPAAERAAVATAGDGVEAPLILVAEDDATNRIVIERQLELLGLAVELAPDGVQALACWQRARGRPRRHVALLTDLHMPGMDGYALAQAIRRHELGAGLPRMPILALTANALKGEALRARAAGIDDYLTKPVPLQLLHATLRHWLPLPVVLAASAAPTASASGGPSGSTDAPAAGAAAGARTTCLWNPAAPRALIGDDAVAVAELVGDFLEMAVDHAETIRAALLRRDGARVAALAHRLKSAALAVGAEALAAECAALERCRNLREAEGFAARLGAFQTVFADTRQTLADALSALGGAAAMLPARD